MDGFKDLITKFELLRHELNSIDQDDPLTSQEVIEKSQELDQIHNKIETYKRLLSRKSSHNNSSLDSTDKKI